jgi:hypothetical protein
MIGNLQLTLNDAYILLSLAYDPDILAYFNKQNKTKVTKYHFQT